MLFGGPPGYNAPAVNRQANQLLGGMRPPSITGVSPTNTLGVQAPGMGGPQLAAPNVNQIIQALLAKGQMQ